MPIQWRVTTGRRPAGDAGRRPGLSWCSPGGSQIGLLAGSEQKRNAANELLVTLGKGVSGGVSGGGAAPRSPRGDAFARQDVCSHRHGAMLGAGGSPCPNSEAGGGSGQVGTCGSAASRAAFLRIWVEAFCVRALQALAAGVARRAYACTAAHIAGECAHRSHL